MASKTQYHPITQGEKEELVAHALFHRVATTTVRHYGGGDGITGQDVELPDFNEQVRRGCILLDAITIGWMDRVDVDQLDLESTEHCVLGQTYDSNPEGVPGYDWQVKAYMNEFRLEPSMYGFDISNDQRIFLDTSVNFKNDEVNMIYGRAWEHLTNTWRTVIRDRKARAARAAEFAEEATSRG